MFTESIAIGRGLFNFFLFAPSIAEAYVGTAALGCPVERSSTASSERGKTCTDTVSQFVDCPVDRP